MNEAFIYDGLRSPFGRHAGALSPVRADDLLADVIRAVVTRSAFSSESFEDVVVGCTNQSGEDCRNIARRSGLLAGLPVEVAGITVNRLCASGLAAVVDASRAIQCGQGDLFVAGGVENMSRSPFVMAKAEQAYGRDVAVFDTALGSRFPNPQVASVYGDHAMYETAEQVGQDLGITRQASDQFAAMSQAKYVTAKTAGFYTDELTPITVPGRKRMNSSMCVDSDEHPRPNTDLAKLSGLRPLVEGGIVTAGNASGINDGAAAVLLMSRDESDRRGLTPLAKIVSWATCGVDPALMGSGPIPASKKALEKAGWNIKDLDLVESNEAFAAQSIAVIKDLKIPIEKVNVNGGAIALGHPIGASGTRIVVTLIHEMIKRNSKKGLATLCIGGGMGIAMCIERD